MNNYLKNPEQHISQQAKALDTLNNRSFKSFDGLISGKSVVIEKPFDTGSVSEDMWPHSLADYLKNYVGKTVSVEYALPNGRFYEKKGELKVAGINFIGIKPLQSDNLFLLELSSIKSINILNYQKK